MNTITEARAHTNTYQTVNSTQPGIIIFTVGINTDEDESERSLFLFAQKAGGFAKNGGAGASVYRIQESQAFFATLRSSGGAQAGALYS